jgi:predicted NAD/FAD-binding protein
MSFSVQVPMQARQRRIEWSGADLAGLFAQKRNLVSPRFWHMLADIVRFNRLTSALAEQGLDRTDGALMAPLGEFLRREGFCDAFRDWYFLPMMGCIWSCPTDQMLAFPVATMVRFCHNHGLLQITKRPQWYSVRGGARRYVQVITERIADKRLNTPVRRIQRDQHGVSLTTDAGTERFDQVVLACHSDQALELLGEGASAPERAVLSTVAYQANVAVLHTDTSVLPKARSAWAAWNYERTANAAPEPAKVCLHYLINRLQALPVEQAVVVSLNPQRPINERLVVGRYAYAHPVFDTAAIRAQAQVVGLQGRARTHFCGAWMGYGFHEDGLKAGFAAAQSVLQALGHAAEVSA